MIILLFVYWLLTWFKKYLDTIASAEENEEDDIDSIDVPIPKISYYEGDSELQ